MIIDPLVQRKPGVTYFEQIVRHLDVVANFVFNNASSANYPAEGMSAVIRSSETNLTISCQKSDRAQWPSCRVGYNRTYSKNFNSTKTSDGSGVLINVNPIPLIRDNFEEKRFLLPASRSNYK